ncbi:MAG: SDR family NAD(P)-dependent oxidoreductase [Azospirillaceae bacterium]
MTGRLADKVAIVFGAGSIGGGDRRAPGGWGNGEAAAVLYAREGARVVAVDRAPEAAEATRARIAEEGGTARALTADVTDSAAVQAAVRATLDAFGRIDVLHNNVGVNEPGDAVDASEESWDRVMAINAKGPFLTCKAVLPVMRRQRGGAIVNIASIAAIRWLGYAYASYYASKAAVCNFTRSVAMENAQYGIRANTILPGLMDTPHIYKHVSSFYADLDEMVQARAELVPVKRMGDAWDVARAALFLASDEARYITGIELAVDGGLHCKVS